jgi:hypothetical protein
MLALPQFLLPAEKRHVPLEKEVSPIDAIGHGFDLSSWFLERNVYGPRGIKQPDERAGLIRKILETLNNESKSIE